SLWNSGQPEEEESTQMNREEMEQISNLVVKTVKDTVKEHMAGGGGTQRYVNGQPFSFGHRVSQKWGAGYPNSGIVHSRGEGAYSLARVMLSLISKDKSLA